MATKYCTLALNICGSSGWNLLHVTLLAPILLRWFLDLLTYNNIGQQFRGPLRTNFLMNFILLSPVLQTSILLFISVLYYRT
jgi:hypothetical protein